MALLKQEGKQEEQAGRAKQGEQKKESKKRRAKKGAGCALRIRLRVGESVKD
jgi:hypothetical protein